MDETQLEKLARLSGKATSKALDALGRRGFDLRGKLSAPNDVEETGVENYVFSQNGEAKFSLTATEVETNLQSGAMAMREGTLP